MLSRTDLRGNGLLRALDYYTDPLFIKTYTKTLLFLFRAFLILYPESSGPLASDWSPVENGELELFLP